MPYALFKHLTTASSLMALTVLTAGMAVVVDSGSAIAQIVETDQQDVIMLKELVNQEKNL